MTQAFEIPRSVSRNVVRDLVLSASTGALDAYAVGGFEPEFVADFSGSLNSGTEYYRSGGADTTFSSVFTHTKGDDKPFTMTDSDGSLKWAPHNLRPRSDGAVADMTSAVDVSDAATPISGFSNSIQFDGDGTLSTAYHTTAVLSGVQYTIAAWVEMTDGGGAPSFSGIYSSSGFAFSFQLGNSYPAPENYNITSLGGNVYYVSATGVGGSITGNVGVAQYATQTRQFKVTGVHVYRSDLGGMVNNPDRGDSYVPTTTAAKFLPRRNHYIYNGSTYDNAGILIESAAATNLVTQSRTLSTTWQISSAGRVQFGTPTTGPDGVSGSAQLLEVGATSGSNARGYNFILTTTAVAHAHSYILRDGPGGTGWVSIATQDDTDGLKYSYFDLRNGVKGTTATGHTTYMTELFDGWYRCTVVNTFASATNTRTWLLMATGDGALSVDSATYPQGTGWVYFYHAQCETGNIETSPIITAGSTVTRAAETLTVAGANLPYSATAMSFQQSGSMTYADLDTGTASATSGQFSFMDWTLDTNNFIKMQIGTASTRTGEIGYKARSAVTFDIVASGATLYSPGIAVGYNLGMRITSSALNGAADGSSFTENATLTSIASLSSQSLKIAASDTSHFYGSVKLFRMWGTDIADSGIETAST